jgi:hypothetical protein
VVPTYMHGRAARNEVKHASAGTGLRAYVHDHVGRAGRRIVEAACGTSKAGAARGETHEACGVSATDRASAGIRTGGLRVESRR